MKISLSHRPETMSEPGAIAVAPALVNPCVRGADMAEGTCSDNGCERASYLCGLCVVHWRALDPEVRFWMRLAMVDGDGCWEWAGSRSPKGYGFASFRGKVWRSSRLAWVLTHGPIPEGMNVCHRCDNPPCCRPDHLFLGTPSDNQRDKVLKGRGNTQKLTVDDVREVRRLIAAGLPIKEIVARTNANRDAVYCIRRGKSWAHLDAVG